MDVFEAIRERYTADAFSERAPSRALIERLIDAAIWAPNHRLTEPWRFAVIAGAEREAFGERLADWLEHGAHDEQPDDDTIRRARRSMMRSPVTVVVIQAAADEGGATRDLEDYAACCAVTQNLMLAAHAEGLTSKWATGRLTTYAGAKQILGLDARDRIVGYVLLGYLAEDAERAERSRTPARVDWRGM